ncbi:MAG: hypothetical protein GC152_04365 [Alphaproteobacteria bacterium]|nr:hypothetical protein [Alphaproteobacteria bacterium]
MGRSHDLILIAYRSRPKDDLALDELARLVSIAREANAATDITAALLHRDDVFIQWLEGPKAAVERLFAKIECDPRHADVEVLVNRTATARLFARWPLLLVERSAKATSSRDGAGRAPTDDGNRIQPQPKLETTDLAATLDALTGSARTHAGHPLTQRLYPNAPDELIQSFADRMASFETAEPIIEARNALEELREPQGLVNLIEGAARRLGDLWARDEIDTLSLTVAVMRMHVMSRRLLWTLGPRQKSPDQAWTILVTPLPGETRAINAVLDIGVLWRDGWRPRHYFPMREHELLAALSEKWFDVLDLVTSGVFGAPQDIVFLRGFIERARNASLNPNLQVVIGGRLFFENNFAGRAVGADASVGSSIEISRAMRRAVRRLEKESGERPSGMR